MLHTLNVEVTFLESLGQLLPVEVTIILLLVVEEIHQINFMRGNEAPQVVINLLDYFLRFLRSKAYAPA
jgi:hypothetical protein